MNAESVLISSFPNKTKQKKNTTQGKLEHQEQGGGHTSHALSQGLQDGDSGNPPQQPQGGPRHRGQQWQTPGGHSKVRLEESDELLDWRIQQTKFCLFAKKIYYDVSEQICCYWQGAVPHTPAGRPLDLHHRTAEDAGLGCCPGEAQYNT